MSLSELQRYTAISKYARYLDKLKRREVWPETVARYEGMLVEKYPDRADKIREVCQSITSWEVMPSMRGLQFGGKPIFQHELRCYNCLGSYCDRLPFFGQAFYALLCGSGVGTSVQECHLSTLPGFSKKRRAGLSLHSKVFKPTDSIEGWADCAHVLASAFFEEPVRGFEEYHDCDVEFDLSAIRRKNSKLSFGIGRAPGPIPLRNALERSRKLFLRCLNDGQDRLRSIDAYDFFMHLADSVVSGGVRRSACIVIFDLWDKLMREAKTGSWYATNPQRGRSNNSALMLRDKVSFEQFQELFESTRQFGEPGFYWANHPNALPNPCNEIGFIAKLVLLRGDPNLSRLLKSYQGPVETIADQIHLSGWQGCNLTTINGKMVKSPDDFYAKCDQASRLGTWQAGFTSFPYFGEVSERIFEREALLGVSIAGVMHHPDILLNPEVLRKGAATVRRTNEEEAWLIGINAAARLTCIKPDGNSAATLGCFSGAHAGKFRRGFRIVQANQLEAPYQHFKSINPQACEPSAWSTNGTDDVIRFCAEYEGLIEDDMTAIEFLRHIRTLYVNWVQAGKVEERCTQYWVSNNVSNTVRVRNDEWDAVAREIYDFRHYYSGVSLLSQSGDRDYVQAPFTSVFLPEERDRMYGSQANREAPTLVAKALAVFRDMWEAADLALGMWGDGREPSLGQVNWVKALGEYAQRFFSGDLRKATYALKDSFNWSLWLRLKESFKPVDYSLMVEKESGVNMQGEVSCQSGACEL